MGKRKRGRNSEEEKALKAMERMERLEEFERNLLPSLRHDITAGLDAEAIYKKYEHLAAARAVTIVATEPDSSKAIAAIKDILDRGQGKATEKKEITHKLAHLPEEELDAYLLTKLKDTESA